MITHPILTSAKNFLEQEQRGIQEVQENLDQQFVTAIHQIHQISGKVIVTGMGKSGHIGRKIAATLSSTGTPSLFLHPAEGVHGDLGVVSVNDVVLAITNSGETEEILRMVPTIRRMGVLLIAMTGNPESSLAKLAEIHLSFKVSSEACPLNLAPTTSTTAALALGDALALCLLEQKNFTEASFALFHPQGALGKKLLTRVEDLMITGDRLPLVSPETSLRRCMVLLAQKRLGLILIVDKNQQLQGVFSSGDLSRVMERLGMEGETLLLDGPIGDHMKRLPLTVGPQELAAKALNVMENHSILTLVVTSPQTQVLGVIQLYDILRAGIA